MDPAGGSEIVFRAKDGFTSMQSARQVPALVLRSMFEDDKMHDVTLCGIPPAGMQLNSLRPIKAYKIVLAHASSHLHDLLTSDGYIDSHQAHYNIENVDHESLRRIVEFIHTDKMTIAEEDAVDAVCGVLVGAKYLVMKNEMADACEKFLCKSEHVKPENCIKLWSFARKFSCLTLMEVTAKFIVESLKDMPESEAFLNMPYADCAKLLLSEAFVVADADARCRAAAAWLNHDPDRGNYVHDMLNMVPFVSDSLLVDTILELAEYEILKKHAPDLLHLAMMNTFKKVKLAHPTSEVVASAGRLSTSNRAWYVVGANLFGANLRDLKNASQFLRYDIESRLWSTLSALPWKRADVAACAIDTNRIVVMGGEKNEITSADIDEYDIACGSWATSHLKLGDSRRCLAACSHNQTVYAVGGAPSARGGIYLSAVESYSMGMSSSRTRTLAGLNPGRYFCAASFATAHNAIFVAGGCSHGDLSVIDKYDFFSDTWSKVGDLTRPRSRLASVFAGTDDNLYCIGGDDDRPLKTVEIFNVRTGQIHAAPSLLEDRAGCRATTLSHGNVVAVLGNIFGDSCAVETYDVREGKWFTGVLVPDMPVSCGGFGFAAV